MGAFISRVALEPAYWLVPLVVWAALVGGSLWWNRAAVDEHSFEVSSEQARQIGAMMEAMRLWNAKHGGVYVWSGGPTQPNPYLKHPERDLRLPDGRELTMVNPAFMTRGLIDIVRESAGVRIHLTSLKPINPGNQADLWESAALAGFERDGGEERIELVGGSEPLFRYMRALRVEEACLQCHRHQGYRVGDVRGGLSVTLPASPMLALAARQKAQLAVLHGAIWLLLAAGTVLVLARLRQQILSLQEANARQDDVVHVRTAELRVEIAERQQAEERLRLLIDSSAEGVLAVDRNGLCTLCNRAAAELLGYPGEALLGQPLRDLIAYSDAAGDARDVRHCPLTAAYRRGIVAEELDSVFWRADGSALPVEYRAHPIHTDDGVVGAVVTFLDISERKRSQAQLRALHAGIEQSPTAIAIFTAECRIDYVNSEFCRLYGYPAEALLGRPVEMLQGEDTAEQALQALWHQVRAGGTWRGELTGRRGDGTSFWQRVSISAINDGSGRPSHAVAVCEDITEQKRAHDEVWRRAHYDALTGLPNRSLFYDRLQQHFAQARRRQEMLALLYVDLDGFKRVNDTLGHEAGDALLVEAGRRMAACLRSGDTVARLGGDEFAIIVHGASSAQEPDFVARRLIELLAQPFDCGGRQAHVAGSVGIALYRGEAAVSVDELVRRADAAMYRAKQQGGGASCRCDGAEPVSG